jgi:peptidyl-prolyl cis-trans isomerase C
MPARRPRPILLLTAALLLLIVAPAVAQQATPPAATPAPTQAPAKDQVLATVYGEPITRSEFERELPQFAVPAGAEQRAYKGILDMMIGTRLLARFLTEQRIPIDPKDVDAMVARSEQEYRQNNTSLADDLARNNRTQEWFRERVARTLQWKAFIDAHATDAELQKYMNDNKDAFSGTQVSASHILIRADANATPDQKAQAKAKIEAIKKEIDSKAISFADAANKYSEDPANKQAPSGGDLGPFPRKDRFIESFSAAAFAMKPGEISNPVETEYGYHLIHVTNRTEGPALEYAKIKDRLYELYAADLQDKVVAAERKKADEAGAIKIEPMPEGLIQPEPVAPPAEAPKAAAPAAPAEAPKAAETPKS